MPLPLGHQPLKRWTGMLAGRHLWHATDDDPGVLVFFTYEGGIPLATVLEGEDQGERHDARDMGGTLDRVTGGVEAPSQR
jgi:hypothetical protein